MKQADAARKVFRELAGNLEVLPTRTLYSSGSDYNHKLVSCLFSRDKKMQVEVGDLKSKLTPEQIKIFRQQMSLQLDQMFAEKVTERKRDVAAERRVDRRTPEERAADEKLLADLLVEIQAYERKKELENPTPPPTPTYGRRKCYRAKSKAS